MDQVKTKRIAAGIIAAVLIVLLLNTVKLYNTNSALKTSQDQEKLKSEKLLSEKLILRKEIEEFKNEISSLQGRNQEIDLLLNKANKNLTERELRIAKLEKEARSVSALKNQLAEVKKIRENLQREIEALAANNFQLKNKNEELNSTVNALLSENKSLSDQLKSKSFAGSNFKVEVIKGNKEKLTVKARKTDKIKIEFEVPSNSYPVDDKLVHINLVTPDGSLLKGEAKVTVENTSELSASLDQSLNKKEPQKVVVEYSIKDKMKQGVYTAIVFHNNSFLGNVQFRLMK